MKRHFASDTRRSTQIAVTSLSLNGTTLIHLLLSKIFLETITDSHSGSRPLSVLAPPLASTAARNPEVLAPKKDSFARFQPVRPRSGSRRDNHRSTAQKIDRASCHARDPRCRTPPSLSRLAARPLEPALEISRCACMEF